MAEIGRWHKHRFEVSPTAIKSFSELQLKASSDTDAVTEGEQQYVKLKNRKALEVSLTVHLHAGLGYDVQSEAEAFVQSATRESVEDYFYIGNKKLVSCTLMLTDATVSEMEISAGGKWISASVALTFKQAAPYDGSTGEKGTGGGNTGGGGFTKLTDAVKKLGKDLSLKTTQLALKAAARAAIQKVKVIEETAKTVSKEQKNDTSEDPFQLRMAKEAYARSQEKKVGSGARPDVNVRA